MDNTTHARDFLTELATLQVGEAFCGMEIRQIQEINRFYQMTGVCKRENGLIGLLDIDCVLSHEDN